MRWRIRIGHKTQAIVNTILQDSGIKVGPKTTALLHLIVDGHVTEADAEALTVAFLEKKGTPDAAPSPETGAVLRGE